jgi:hypothetical protein
MNPGVVLVLLTKMDLTNFLPLSREMLGYSPAKAADGVSVPLPALAHQLACVAAFKDETAPPTVRTAAPQFDLFHAGFLVAADERDMIEILETASLPFTHTETLMRGVDAVILSGSLSQWRDAVKLACHPKTKLSRGARQAFNFIYKTLCKEGLKDMFDDLQATEQSDHTFLLERRR